MLYDFPHVGIIYSQQVYTRRQTGNIDFYFITIAFS